MCPLFFFVIHREVQSGAHLAREIVIIGFATIIITIGAISVVVAAIGGKSFLEKIGNTINEKQSD